MSRVTDEPTDTLPLSATASAARARAKERLAVVAYHRGGAAAVTLSPGESVVIGRRRPAQLVVDDENVSKEHARFSWDGRTVTVEDLDSLNGTTVNGAAVSSGEAKAGDDVRLGELAVGLHPVAAGEPRVKGLASHDAFVTYLEDEVARAVHFRRPLVVMLVQGEHPDTHVRAFAPAVVSGLGRVDKAALYSDAAVEVLLAERDLDAALELAKELRAGCGEAGSCVRVGIAAYPDGGTNAQALLASARDALYDAREQGGVAHASARRAKSSGGRAPVQTSSAARALFQTVAKLGASSIPVLVQGETGAGKEVVARTLHDDGVRADKPFLAVNCGAIPEQLVESTLFGHEKGAFTGAGGARAGVFESADGGTVFLDEIGELSAGAQAALLRVLEERKLTRVGGTREIEVDVRMVAATHRDLDDMVAAGSFRQDLLFRINAMTVRVPPLRERPEDIEVLAERFVAEAARSHGVPPPALSDEVVSALNVYDWPGNIRELKNAMERAVVIAGAPELSAEDLPDRLRRSPAPAPRSVGGRGTTRERGDSGERDLRSELRDYERAMILEALEEADGVQTEAAKLLSLPLRTLVHKMKKLGIRRKSNGYVIDDEG
jgi:DNA-binding NtrC family response regulator